MALFRKKTDPLSDRARALNEEIAQLESQIKKLDGRLQKEKSQPKLRSTARPQAETINYSLPPEAPEKATSPQPKVAEEEVILEQADVKKIENQDNHSTPEHFNELGVRKYDLPGLLRRVRKNIDAPATTNPRLVSYLAAGGIQGLRPLRHEKRVARNRFIVLVIVLFFTLLGIAAVFLRQH